ncbi:357_t:CDS:2, partial [Gigaspora rosea]
LHSHAMSQNKVKSVTVEDETLSPSTSDVETAGTKQDLVNQLVSEAKRKNVLVGSENSGKGKTVELDDDPKPSFADGSRVNFKTGQAFADIFGNPSPHSGSSSSKMGYIEKQELSKARNQWEYNEWCKADPLLDKALITGEVEFVHLARQVALERPYVVQVADEDGWSVAAKIAMEESMNPMSKLFSGKRERAKMAA